MPNRMASRRRNPVQQSLAFPSRGGRRNRAGRKKDLARALTTHEVRPELSERHPAHVTLRMRRDVWNLRSRRSFRVLERALRGSKRQHVDARFVHFAVLGDHIHLIVEATDRQVLARRVQGLEIRIARALNRMMDRRGAVFADRYHVHVLRNPTETRNAIAYVLRNAARHYGVRGVDPYSSGVWFDGWRDPPRTVESWSSGVPPPTSAPDSWLLKVGWKKLGLIGVP